MLSHSGELNKCPNARPIVFPADCSLAGRRFGEVAESVGGIIDVVHSGTGVESINDMELMWVPRDREHKRFALNIILDLCWHFIFG